MPVVPPRRECDGALLPRRGENAPTHFRRSASPASARRGALGGMSVARIPDNREDVLFILAGGATQIGVKLLGTEDGIGEAEADIVRTRGLTGPDPASTDFDHPRKDAIIGLVVFTLGCVDEDFDGRTEAKRAQMAFVTAVILHCDLTDGGHEVSPCSRRRPFSLRWRSASGGERPHEPRFWPAGASADDRSGGFFGGRRPSARSRAQAR